MSPVELSPALRTASTSSTIWAQPSKEWVIPAKPKPGRKPKETNTNATILKDDIEESSGSRRVQNRTAQRAFRERKQTQLAELLSRLHSYERGEIERSVALQNIAKRMKEENEELREENQMLREHIARMEREHEELLDKDKDRKRAYDSTSTSFPTLPPTDDSARKRARVGEGEQESLPPALPPSFPLPLSSAPDDIVPDVFSPVGQESHSRHSSFPPSINSLLSFTSTSETTTLNSQVSLDSYTCILCTTDTPCLCSEVTVPQANNNSSSLHQLPFQCEDLNRQSIVSLDQSVQPNTLPIANANIMDNLPAFQAPVPIRRRTGTSKANPVFPITSMAASSLPSVSKCSGDPENCMACADDSFGKAFCQAISHTVNSTLPCIDCPQRTSQTDKILIGGCCGDISNCGSCGIAPITSSTTPPRGPETIPTDDAWHQLKSHPSVAFADLTLLAEVVARRSKCTGSRVVISPVLDSVAPDHQARLSHHDPSAASEDQSVLPMHPHEQFRQQQAQRESPPRLVPQHVLIECGRRRVKEVNADGVREALRLLDQKFAHMR